jgi:glycosyltransferase involved in cell wall biosynthesis
VADRIEFLGQRNDVPALLTGATLLAHTAENEGCPNAVMEAMASGRAVVSTDAGDVPALVDNGVTGFVVAQDEHLLLADRLERLMADAALCRRMGEAGRVKAKRDFGLDRLVSQTLAAYRAAGWQRQDVAATQQRGACSAKSDHTMSEVSQL